MEREGHVSREGIASGKALTANRLERKTSPRTLAYLAGNFPFKAPLPTPAVRPTAEKQGDVDTDQKSAPPRPEHWVIAKLRFQKPLSRDQIEWAEENPQAFDEIMRQHVARREWYKVPLAESEEKWLAKHPLGAEDTTSEAGFLREMLELRQEELKVRSVVSKDAA